MNHMKNTGNILIVTGSLFILSPFAYVYFTNRLVAQALYPAIERGELDYKIKFNQSLPEYYIPICLILGLACIGIGVFSAWRGDKKNSFDITQ